MAQRVLAAKSIDHGRWGSLFAGLLKLPILFIMVLPGTMAILLYPNLEKPDMVFPTLMFDFTSHGIIGSGTRRFFGCTNGTIDFYGQFSFNIGNNGLCPEIKTRSIQPSTDVGRSCYHRSIYDTGGSLGTTN